MADEQDELIGRLIGGQYRVVDRIGTGAMAAIYRGVDEKDQRPVALKIVKPAIVRNKTAAARFHREAKAASKLQHEGIVGILDWGFDRDVPFIAMELVEGEDLFDLLERRGALPEDEVMRILIKLCEALQAAHQEGVVHRDLKPENIMVSYHPMTGDIILKVLDFGIAKLVGPGPGDMWGDETVPQVLTKVGSAVGTPSHMAPEQARGDPVDGRTDIYACGVLMYEMATGHLPFEGNNPLQVAIRQVRDPPPPPRSHKPDINPELEDIILRALEKEPDARFQSAAELMAHLHAVLVALDADQATMQRSLNDVDLSAPGEDEDDAEIATAQRDVPQEVIDAPPSTDDGDARTAEREIPDSVRDSSELSTAQREVPPLPDQETERAERASLQARPRKLVTAHEIDDPQTTELDTEAGPTMRQKVIDVRAIIDAALQSSPTMVTGPHAPLSGSGTIVEDPQSSDETPFIGRDRIPRPTVKARLRALTERAQPADDEEEESIATAVTAPPDLAHARVEGLKAKREAEALVGTTAPLEASEGPHPIDDEDSEGAIPTVVSDPAGLSSAVERMVRQARAAVEDEPQTQETAVQRPRIQALSVTQQSEFGVAGESAIGAPRIEIVPLSSDVAPEQPDSAVPSSLSDPSEAIPPRWSHAPGSRGAAGELEELLKQMPRTRQPIWSSMIVLVLIGLAILALMWLLVGAATF